MTDSAFAPAMALALILAAPLFGALAAMVMGRRGAGIALATVIATVAGILTLLVIIAGDGAFTLAIGGWEAPLGISVCAPTGFAAGFRRHDGAGDGCHPRCGRQALRSGRD